MKRPNYETPVAKVGETATVREVADLMANYSVGCVVVVDADRRPIGIVTDRDLCTRVVARRLDPAATAVAAVMTKPAQVARSDEPLEAVAARMRQAGVRRLPVVEDGRLVGIVALDDLVTSLGSELSWLGSAAKLEVREGLREARSSRRRAELEETLASLEASALATGREAFDFVAKEFETLRDRLRKLRAGSKSDTDEDRTR
jgi:signal-transduction protein with cAMP-binding, CBS, and nucleotidyltransferase domain